MNSRAKETISSNTELGSSIVAILDRATEPRSLKLLSKELSASKKSIHMEQLQQAIEALLAEGKVFVWGTPARLSYWNCDPFAQTRSALLDATKTEPQSAAQLKIVALKTFPGISKQALSGLLNQLLAEKLLFECSAVRKGGKPRYSPSPSTSLSLDDVILAKIKRQRISAPALLSEVVSSLPQTTEIEFGAALHRLERSGRIFRHPPIKKALGLKWGRNRPNLAAQFSALATVDKKRQLLLESGFSREAVDAAIRSKLTRSVIEFRVPEDLAERLLVIVRASRQPVLSLPVLRLLVNCSKPEFDLAILKLRNSGRALLMPHDNPQSLNEKQRQDLVSEAGDLFYTGITHFASRSSGFHPAL